MGLEIRGDINEVYLDLYRYFLGDEEYKNKLEKVVSGLSYTNQVEKATMWKILFSIIKEKQQCERYYLVLFKK